MSLNAIGIALVFPILTLAILDMYPRQRGAASSMQAFVGLSFNAIIAGAVSPWVAKTPLRLSLTAAGFCAVAWVLWRIYRAQVKRAPAAPQEAAGLEPTERL
jgi:DHA1 family bicyclomycin/chloramphenicol resistance-like MFS transporter